MASNTLTPKKNLSRRAVLKGVCLGLGVATLSAGILERERIGQFFQFVESFFAKASFANSPLVQGFLHPEDIACPSENTPIQLAPGNPFYEIDEAGDSVGKGFFWHKDGTEGSAPVSLFYGDAVKAFFLNQNHYGQQRSDGSMIQNVAVKGTVLSDLPQQFTQLEFLHPTMLMISDGGNLLLQWCIQHEAFLLDLLAQFSTIASASNADLQNLQKALQKLKTAIDSVCLILQGHFEIALGDLLALKLNNAQINTVVLLGIGPVWKAATIPLSADFHPQKTFPMRGNQAAEVFGRYLVTSGNNAIKAAMNNASDFLKQYGIALRYQDITDIVEVMDGIHPVPSEQRKIARELLRHTFSGETSLGNIAIPAFFDR